VVGADHELRGDRRAIGRCPQVGDIPLEPGQRPGLGFQFPVHAPGAAGQPDEPVALGQHLPGDRLLRLGDLLVDRVWGEAPARARAGEVKQTRPIGTADEAVAKDQGGLGVLELPSQAASVKWQCCVGRSQRRETCG
jgi:hypothetical protein